MISPLNNKPISLNKNLTNNKNNTMPSFKSQNSQMEPDYERAGKAGLVSGALGGAFLVIAKKIAEKTPISWKTLTAKIATSSAIYGAIGFVAGALVLPPIGKMCRKMLESSDKFSKKLESKLNEDSSKNNKV